MVEKVHSSQPPLAAAETVVAISTPPAQAGIGIIRLSGPQALPIGRKLFRSNGPTLGNRVRHVELGAVIGEQGQEIDQGLAWVFTAPHSYTGEDTVEISCHGNLLILEAVVRAAILHGAVLAQPGEFTRRAFLNGKIDLIQAEAVVDLIRASGQFSLDNAYGLLNGRLSDQITQIRQAILHSLAHAEAMLDFAEEVAIDSGVITASAASALLQCTQLTSTFSTLSRRGDGFLVAIIGPPNAGKSSLFNHLLQESRAIVSPHPGTTRDLIESRLYIDGELFRIVDSAGLHRATDPVEQEGISRAYEAAEQADLVLLVLDSSLPWTAEYTNLVQFLDPQRDLIVLNKSDLPRQLTLPCELPHTGVAVSVLLGTGVSAIVDHLKTSHSAETRLQGAGLTRLRHYEGLRRTQDHLERALARAHQPVFPVECFAADLHAALGEVSALLGVNVGDEVLDLIFSEFCIGK